MPAISSSQLLNIWEWGIQRSPIQQALLLLAAAWPERSLDELAQLSLGQRDGLLLKLREETFGSQIASKSACPACGESIELSFQISDISVEETQKSNALQDVYLDGYALKFRLPNSLDMTEIAASSDDADLQTKLLQRCLEYISHNGQAISVDLLSQPIIDAVQTQMAEADPQADVQLALVCPACQHNWQAIFDIVTFFWSEIDSWAKRMLQEIHLIASAYGWRESEILALSAQRRQVYLEMIRA